MNPDDLVNQKRSFLRKVRDKIFMSYKWYKRNPKALVISLFILLIIQHLFSVALYNLVNNSNPTVFNALVILILLPISQVSNLLEVFVLYWLIEIYTSKLKMHLILMWILNTLLLVIIYTAIYTVLLVATGPSSYYLSSKIIKLIGFEIYSNYHDLLYVFKSSGITSGIYSDTFFFIGNLWPHLTLLLPTYYFLKQLKSRKKLKPQDIVAQEYKELNAYQEKYNNKYFKKHGAPKPDFTWHRFELKVFVGIGYLSLYLSALLFTFLLTMIDWIFGVKFIIDDLFEMTLMTIVGIFLWLLGMWVLKRKKKELDDHYRISAYKINWRINISISILMVFAILGTLFPREPKILGPEDFSFIASTLILIIIAFTNSLRFRRKYKNKLKSLSVTLPKSIENNDNNVEIIGS